jgi:hypothetical protein
LANETGSVGLTQLAIASWQCPGSFITPDLEFPGQTRHSSCSPGSLLSRHDSLWFLVVPQIEEVTEGFPFWQTQGHHAERDEETEKPFRNASSSGKNDGLSVWSHKGPTLKGIRNWAPPRYTTFFSWPKVGYFLDRVVFFLCVAI